MGVRSGTGAYLALIQGHSEIQCFGYSGMGEGGTRAVFRDFYI